MEISKIKMRIPIVLKMMEISGWFAAFRELI